MGYLLESRVGRVVEDEGEPAAPCFDEMEALEKGSDDRIPSVGDTIGTEVVNGVAVREGIERQVHCQRGALLSMQRKPESRAGAVGRGVTSQSVKLRHQPTKRGKRPLLKPDRGLAIGPHRRCLVAGSEGLGRRAQGGHQVLSCGVRLRVNVFGRTRGLCVAPPRLGSVGIFGNGCWACSEASSQSSLHVLPVAGRSHGSAFHPSGTGAP